MNSLCLLAIVALLGVVAAYELKVEYKKADGCWETYFDQCDIKVPLFDAEDDCEDRGLSYLIETEIDTTVQFFTSYSHETDDDNEQENYRIAAQIFPRDEDCDFEWESLFDEAVSWRVTFRDEQCMEGRTPFDCEFYLDTQMEENAPDFMGFSEAECDEDGIYFEGEFEAADLFDNCDEPADLLAPLYFYFELAWSLPFEVLEKEQACICHFCEAHGDRNPVYPEDCAGFCEDYCDIADLCDDCSLPVRFRNGICDGFDPNMPSYYSCNDKRAAGDEVVPVRSAGMVQKHQTNAIRTAKKAKGALKLAAKKAAKQL